MAAEVDSMGAVAVADMAGKNNRPGYDGRLVGTSRMAGGAATDVPARKAGGMFAVGRPSTLVAPLYAARTAQRAVPTIELLKFTRAFEP